MPTDTSNMPAMAKLKVLSYEAAESGKPLRRYLVPAVRPDHPGKEGYELGVCDGCGTKVLIAEGFIDRPADAGATVFNLCDEGCFSASVNSSNYSSDPAW